ncbi:hypothetical protein IMAU30143_01245 [Lactobacillus helveticus]|nr:hypothetical protein [Lactobacillus helveticus]
MYTQDLDHLPFKKEDLEEKILKSGAIEWAYILHDKDLDDKSKKIRAHYHVVVRYKDAKTLSRVASIFGDKPQYFEAWHGTINNAYSYLIHETLEAKDNSGKHHYDPSEVKASFDFKARIEAIRKRVKKPSRADIKNLIDDYSNSLISKEKLQDEIGIFEMAKHKNLIDHIDEILAYNKHQKFLKDFKDQKCTTYWLYGSAGVGKTILCRSVVENLKKDFCILGSQRDHFQSYKGENYIILNDLRPTDYQYGQLLTLLDPWENDKVAPSRYHDKYLNARVIFITTPYDPVTFYNSCNIENRLIDTVDQLQRRVISMHVTEANLESIKTDIIKDIEIGDAIFKIKNKKILAKPTKVMTSIVNYNYDQYIS